MIWTDEMKNFVFNNYKGITTVELAERFNAKFGTNLSWTSFRGFLSRYKLSNGVDTKFKKGHIPFNKGKKIEHIHPNSKKTQFKSGHKPKNWCPIGTERIDKEGYVYVKVNDLPKVKKKVNWKQKSHIVWEQTHGKKIPQGSKIMYLDGNKQNLDPNNLELITYGESAALNKKGYRNNNAALTQAGLNIIRIENAIKNKNRKENRKWKKKK